MEPNLKKFMLVYSCLKCGHCVTVFADSPNFGSQPKSDIPQRHFDAIGRSRKHSREPSVESHGFCGAYAPAAIYELKSEIPQVSPREDFQV